MSKRTIGFIGLASMFIFGYMVGNYWSRIEIGACEASLPRYQHCKLTAIPDKGE